MEESSSLSSISTEAAAKGSSSQEMSKNDKDILDLENEIEMAMSEAKSEKINVDGMEIDVDTANAIAIAAAAADDGNGGSASLGGPKSYRCKATGKLFRTMRDVEIYAERTGNDDFEETNVEIPPMTPEEKAQKLKDLQNLLKKKREEKQENEKKATIDAEKKRREEGKSHGQIREELAKMQRDREYEARKKEKIRFNAEREKLKMELAKDKGERAAEKARREGKDPKVAYDEAFAKALGKVEETKASELPPAKREEIMDKALDTLSTYKTGGDGLKAMQTIKTMIGNIIKSPDEPKFRKVNLGNEALKKKVTNFIGSLDFLRGCGFEKSEVGDEKFLILNTVDASILQKATSKLDAAIAKMSQ